MCEGVYIHIYKEREKNTHMQKYIKKIELRCSLTPTARNRFQSISQSDSVV